MTQANRALALDGSRQAQVLLKNSAVGGLPLKKAAKVLLVGPHAQSTELLGGNYFEDICATGGASPGTQSQGTSSYKTPRLAS